MSEKLRKMAKNIKPKVTNKIVDDTLVITLSGSVGEPYWYDDKEEDFINERRVKSLVGDSNQDIIIKLNSPGGDVFDGIATYNYLKGLDNHVTIEVTALAASAASIIAMAGDDVVMCTGSQMMIHEASTITWGNKADHYKTINALETIDNSIVSVYADKSGVDRDTITNWVNGETWFTAEEAVEQGLADKVKNKTETTTKELYSDNEIVAKQVSTIDLDTNEIVTQVIEHFKNNTKQEKPKTGLNKLFGGKK